MEPQCFEKVAKKRVVAKHLPAPLQALIEHGVRLEVVNAKNLEVVPEDTWAKKRAKKGLPVGGIFEAFVCAAKKVKA